VGKRRLTWDVEQFALYVDLRARRAGGLKVQIWGSNIQSWLAPPLPLPFPRVHPLTSRQDTLHPKRTCVSYLPFTRVQMKRLIISVCPR